MTRSADESKVRLQWGDRGSEVPAALGDRVVAVVAVEDFHEAEAAVETGTLEAEAVVALAECGEDLLPVRMAEAG